MTNRNETPYPLVGTVYRLRHANERYPHFEFAKGAVGLVVEAKDNLIRLRMFEEPDTGSAEEWDNEIVWTDEPDTPGQFHADCEQVALANTFKSHLPVYIPYCDYRKNLQEGIAESLMSTVDPGAEYEDMLQRVWAHGRSSNVWVATMDAGSFEMIAFGLDEEHARVSLRLGWIRHCEQYDAADLSYCFDDNITTYAVSPGTCLRDKVAIVSPATGKETK